jgi:hypothetical protein
MSVHMVRGLVPRSAGTQVPTLPTAAQVKQAPVQAVWQQTPSAQKPDPQVAPVVHDCPIAEPPVWPSVRPPSVPPPSVGLTTDPSGFVVPASGLRVCAPPLQPAARLKETARATANATLNARAMPPAGASAGATTANGGARRTLGWGEPMLMSGPFSKEALNIYSRWPEDGDFVSRSL